MQGGFKQEGGNTARVTPRRDLEKSEDRVEILATQIFVQCTSCCSGGDAQHCSNSVNLFLLTV